jgi:tetratricopeptide (TPR) repeat protein
LKERIDEARTIIQDLRARFPKPPDGGPGALAALPTLRDGWHLATEGRIPEAVAAYAKAQELDPSLSPAANVWRTLCWNGSVRGHAAEVLDACERMVELTPHGGARDVRGLARALTGDGDGAVADFEAFVAWTQSDRDKELRQEWIEALRRGEDPFTPELLESLR